MLNACGHFDRVSDIMTFILQMSKKEMKRVTKMHQTFYSQAVHGLMQALAKEAFDKDDWLENQNLKSKTRYF